MQLIVKKKIGKEVVTFMVEGKNPYECQMEAQKLSFGDIEECGVCESDNIHLNARLAQNKYKYLEIKCFKCKASLVFGQTQEDPNTFYLRRDKETKKYDWKPYNPEINE